MIVLRLANPLSEPEQSVAARRVHLDIQTFHNFLLLMPRLVLQELFTISNSHDVRAEVEEDDQSRASFLKWQ
ncbi:hypothetical protein Tco_0656976 [Tanacetum coccineum]|uniref:Uncharacterized protein n=1 Tax=Tanacetum coccineum TaxID=301880 RepID=A0ABQ4XAA5_9ASTR